MAWLALTGGDSYQETRNGGPSMGDSGYRVGTEGRGRDNDSALGLSLGGVQGHDLEGWLDALPKQCLRCPRVAWPLSWPLWPVLDPAQPRPSHSQEGWLDAPVAISVNIVPTPTPLPDVPEPTPNVVEAVPPDPIAAFVAGYRAFSGSPPRGRPVLMGGGCGGPWDSYAASAGGDRRPGPF